MNNPAPARACIYVVSGEVLREKLGLPPDVTVVAVSRDTEKFNVFNFVLDGIGYDVWPGDRLLSVSGTVQLETEGDLKWVIKP